MRCYGVEDLDEPFYCDICLIRRKRQDLESKKREMKCCICQKGGCMMKVDFAQKMCDNVYYHPFCVFTTSRTYYKNVTKVKQLMFDSEGMECFQFDN